MASAQITHIRRAGTIAIAAGLAVTAGAWAQPPDDQSLPIREITLYRSGVGHFVRSGAVRDDATVELTFRTEQINDILKSMAVLDLDGGRVGAIGYASREPLSKKLASFAIDISDQPDLPTLLGRLRGSPISVATVDGRTEGTILGVESRTRAAEETTLAVPYLTLLTDDGIEAVEIGEVVSFRLLDESLASELNKALQALAEHRADTTKAVAIDFRGQGRRRVAMSYVHEMPVWKTSYRVILPDASGATPRIQGWAIVENTTDADWEEVSLSLVAGRPVGFTMDLYQPLFMARPSVPVPVMRGVGPTVYESGRGGAELEDRADRDVITRQRYVGGVGGQSPAEASPRRAAGLASMDMAESAAAARATAGEIGEVFQYRLDAPVSIERQQSAMLPILSTPLEGRRVSIYNPGTLGSNPMRGVELTNTSGLQLMPGPISVYDGDAYAGDAQIGHVSQGEQRLISYAVDLAVDANSETTQSGRVETVRIVNGVIEQVTRSVRADAYSFENNDKARPRTILVEHPRQPGWDLVEPGKPAQTTDSHLRFELDVAAGGTAELIVRQERIQRSRYELTGYDLETLLRYQRMGRASERVVEAFREAVRLRDLIDQSRRTVERLEAERETITRDQDRIRQNMASVDSDSDLYRRYVAKLSEQETRLETIGKEMEAARATLAEREKALEQYLQDLDVD